MILPKQIYTVSKDNRCRWKKLVLKTRDHIVKTTWLHFSFKGKSLLYKWWVTHAISLHSHLQLESIVQFQLPHVIRRTFYISALFWLLSFTSVTCLYTRAPWAVMMYTYMWDCVCQSERFCDCVCVFSTRGHQGSCGCSDKLSPNLFFNLLKLLKSLSVLKVTERGERKVSRKRVRQTFFKPRFCRPVDHSHQVYSYISPITISLPNGHLFIIFSSRQYSGAVTGMNLRGGSHLVICSLSDNTNQTAGTLKLFECWI